MIPLEARKTQARSLLANGQHQAALDLIRAGSASERAALRALEAGALKGLGRLDEALALRRAEVTASPNSAVAEHNLASLLSNMGQAAEAEAAARRALAKGGDAPETWLVLARALVAQSRHDEADPAFRAAIARRPEYVDAVRDLSQLIWMATADGAAAVAPIDAALAVAPRSAALHVVRAKAQEYAGVSAQEVWAGLSAAPGDDVAVQSAAADAALSFDRDRALDHARRAVALAPRETRTRLTLATVHLARGEVEAAETLIDAVLTEVAHDQTALGLKATAERMRGLDGGLNDHATLVRGWMIDTPPGWADLPAYLTDLVTALRAMHRLKSHPVGQSLRHGSQTTVDLSAREDPAIRAFFVAIDGPIRRHLAHLGTGDDPVRRRNTGDYALAGCWSVLLFPGGHHAPHFHPKGWLSSACHIDLPSAIETGTEGWLGFGAPPFEGVVPLPIQHREKPAPGRLVLFPSYMWHQTEPFSGEQTRLTVAFDVIPR